MIKAIQNFFHNLEAKNEELESLYKTQGYYTTPDFKRILNVSDFTAKCLTFCMSRSGDFTYYYKNPEGLLFEYSFHVPKEDRANLTRCYVHYDDFLSKKELFQPEPV